MAAAAEANDQALGRVAGPLRAWTLGVIALAEGKAPEAEAKLRQAADTIVCPICPLPDQPVVLDYPWARERLTEHGLSRVRP